MKLVVSIIFFSLALLSLPGYGEDKHSHEVEKESSAVESLSPELRVLLTQEMLALRGGMMSIIPAYVSGNWNEIESIAKKIENSYIMKQNLTDEQMKELHASLPDPFVKLDQKFHYLAGMLSHAAKNKKVELVGFYFSKLSETCIACHSQYATHKFPALVVTEEINGHLN